jgi:predicted nuclease of restriction endonuclease-like (RecB) superfamily
VPNELLPDGYADLLAQVKADVQGTRLRAARAANTELISLYWRIGKLILDRQGLQGWGTRVIDRLAADLRKELGDQRGWSRSNLFSMRALAAAWPEQSIVQQIVGRLPWGQVTVLLKLHDAEDRDWYARRAAADGWSRKVLEHHIATGLRSRIGAAPNNFPALLDSDDADLAREIVRDPYVFDFLGIAGHVSERQLEDSLIERLQDTLREFGCAFVDRQVRIEVDGDEYFIDLLLFHIEQLRYVVVELKIGKFEPAHLGQLGFYVNVVDSQRRNPDRHAATVGILVCTQGKEQTIRFALGSVGAPMAVATYTYDTLPAAERAALPTADDLAAAVIPTPTLAGDYAHQLLEQLAAINPKLGHPRSMRRASSTLLDILQGKPEQMLIDNTAQRFSNGHSVQLSDQEALTVLTIIRALYDAQTQAAEGSTDIADNTTT